MSDILSIVSLVMATCTLAAMVVVLIRLRAADASPLLQRLEVLSQALERLQRDVSADFSRGRQESSDQARALREEVQGALHNSTESLVQSVGTISNVQQQRLEDFSQQLRSLKSALEESQSTFRQELSISLSTSRDALDKRLAEQSTQLQQHFEGVARRLSEFSNTTQDVATQNRKELATQLGTLMQNNENRIEQMRQTVDGRLKELQTDNATRLEEMRKTVDEKLQSTLERRLSESFKLVSERLEQVHNGLGEMRQLASGVGDLKKVLTNVKTRGTWGEIQLGNLLEQILTPEQYCRNVITRPGSRESVEFAVKLPGRDDQDGKSVWLPMDAKFPKEDYERLVDASERGDAVGVEAAGKALEDRVKSQARDIRDKYVAPPFTTDFALLYLPTESLYAEVLRRPGMVDLLQRDYRVVIVGPTTLAALLNSLQMGFRTLAIQKRSSEVWKVLGAVKTEFGKFGDILERVKKKLDETSNTIDEAASRSRQLEKKLKKVEALPEPEATVLLAESETGAIRETQLPSVLPTNPGDGTIRM